MRKARLGSRDKVRLICSLSDMMGNTYDVVYDIVYDISICVQYSIRYHILYIVYDIVCIHDVVYDVQYMTSYTMSYTISYAISVITNPEIYSAGLTAPASRRRFRVSAPLRLDS